MEEIFKAYIKLTIYLVEVEYKSKWTMMDNDTSTLLLKTHHKWTNNCLSVSGKHDHRVNASERSNKSFKDHFISGLCSNDINFSIGLWDTLMVQSQYTLNMIKKSCTNPRLLEYEQLGGTFYFNKTSITHPGTLSGVYTPYTISNI